MSPNIPNGHKRRSPTRRDARNSSCPRLQPKTPIWRKRLYVPIGSRVTRSGRSSASCQQSTVRRRCAWCAGSCRCGGLPSLPTRCRSDSGRRGCWLQSPATRSSQIGSMLPFCPRLGTPSTNSAASRRSTPDSRPMYIRSAKTTREVGSGSTQRAGCIPRHPPETTARYRTNGTGPAAVGPAPPPYRPPCSCSQSAQLHGTPVGLPCRWPTHASTPSRVPSGLSTNPQSWQSVAHGPSCGSNSTRTATVCGASRSSRRTRPSRSPTGRLQRFDAAL